MWSWASSDKHLLEQPFLEGLGVGDLVGHAFDLAVEGGEEVGDLGLFCQAGKSNGELSNLLRTDMRDSGTSFDLIDIAMEHEGIDVLVDEWKRRSRQRSNPRNPLNE